MYFKEVTELCRLCLKNENLVCVFDKRFETTQNMRDVIFTTTGVEIAAKDVVSKNICKKCLQIVIKIYQFRESSLKNDTFLKNKYEELQKSAHPFGSIQGESSYNNNDIKAKLSLVYHPSVKYIMNTHPNLVLPETCLYINISPYVAMPMNYVETYFKKRNMNMQKYISYALEAINSDITSNESKAKKENKPYLKHSEDESKDKKQFINLVSVDHNNKIKIQTVERIDDSRPKIKSVLNKTFSSRDSTPDFEYPRRFRKRRISDSSSCSENKENPKPSTSGYLDSSFSCKKSKCDTEDLVQMSYVERTLEICDICNSVQYSRKDLQRHKLKHLRCQFCKERFKTMEQKEEHIKEECVVRKTMNSLPKIYLTKIELDKSVRRKYANAFVEFTPILELEGSTNTSNKNIDDKTSDSMTVTENATAENPHTSNDIIEIISDEEENTEHPNVLSNLKTVEQRSTTVSSTNENLVLPQLIPLSSTGTSDVQPPVHSDDLPTLSSSIVKPDIRIKNNIVLETIDPTASDLMVLKDLLKNYKKIKLTKDSATQPELPSNTSIIKNLNDFTTTLKDLNHQLKIYRIPVEIKHGVYKVAYDYSPKPKKIRKISDWNHLTPKELKSNKNKQNSCNVINNVTNAVKPPNITIQDLLSTHRTYSVPKKISTTNPFPINTSSVITTPTLTNCSTSQGVLADNPPPYNSVDVISPSRSINTISNQLPSVMYHQNNTVLAQLLYQPNAPSTVLVNQSNNYASYNSNNSVYNSSAPVITPNNVPQVLVTSTPLFSTNPVLNANSVESLSVLPTVSTAVLPAISTAVLSTETPSTSGVSSLLDTSLSHSSCSTPNHTSNSSMLTPPISCSNNLNNSSAGPIYCVENVLGINTVSSTASTAVLPSTSTTMPLIRVKDLGLLK